MPLGVQEGDIAEQLIDLLDSLGTARGQAAHVRVNQARMLVPPASEWYTVATLLPLLQTLDAALDRVCMNL
jgi:hypothetical protein